MRLTMGITGATAAGTLRNQSGRGCSVRLKERLGDENTGTTQQGEDGGSRSHAKSWGTAPKWDRLPGMRERIVG